jgi:peptidyl-prolyl cis-trans isomerase C
MRSDEQMDRTAAAPAATLEVIQALLRSRALEQGLLPEQHDEAALTAAIDLLLEREVVTPEPTDEECSRFYATHLDQFSSGDRSTRAHPVCGNARCAAAGDPRQVGRDVAGPAARRTLDALAESVQLPGRTAATSTATRDEIVPEFAEAVSTAGRRDCCRRWRTRYGFHIVLIDQRVPGQTVPFEAVHERIAAELREKAVRALRQYAGALGARRRRPAWSVLPRLWCSE